MIYRMKAVMYLWCIGAVIGVCSARQVYNGKIVGGEAITIEDAPYQVSLQRGGHVCGGSLVTERHVVTAAHCVEGASSTLGYQVRVGVTYLNSGGISHDLETIHVHPNYTDLDYDVAVIKLKTAVNFTETVGKVDMISSGEFIEGGKLVNVVGWGVIEENGWYLSDQLRRVSVPALSQETCAWAYHDIFSITPRMLCAGLPSGGKDSCQGDSGGGLTFDGRLAGIVSFGLGCARPGYPGVYTRLAAVRTWVDSVVS